MTTPAGRSLVGRLRKLRAAADRVENLRSSDSLTANDVTCVYEGLFLRCFTGVETYLEDLFYEVALDKVPYPVARGIRPRASIASKVVLQDVLLQGRKYVDWLPYDKTLVLASAHLRGGRPFSELSSSRRQELEDWTTIRHAIAHSSQAAMKAFERRILARVALPQSQRNPVGYLRSQARINPTATRFDLVLDGVVQLVRELDP